MLNVESLIYFYNRNTPYQVRALNKLSFSVARGEVIGVIGPTGSGKSCLLKCLAGALSPDFGKVLFNHSTVDKSIVKVGLIIQEPEQQFFSNTVFEEVSLPLTLKNEDPESIITQVNEVLNKVGYLGDQAASPFCLSGGQQRRVAIASILILNPEILLLDEPTVGMDAYGLEMIRKTVADFRQKNSSVFIASHDLDFLYSQVDRYLVLKEGILLADFKKSQFEDYSDLLLQNGIGIPEIVNLKHRTLPYFIYNYLNAEIAREEKGNV